jgi:hypothetical protein
MALAPAMSKRAFDAKALAQQDPKKCQGQFQHQQRVFDLPR